MVGVVPLLALPLHALALFTVPARAAPPSGTPSGTTPAPAPEQPKAPPRVVDPPPPSHGVLLALDAYGTLVSGHVVVDTAKLRALGIELWLEDGRIDAPVVGLTPGLRVSGLTGGDRLVDEAIDSLMYFDANADTYLDGADPAFAALSVFTDKNADQRIGPGEVRSLESIGVASISRFGSVQMKPRR